MATRAELMREIKGLRDLAESQFSRIDRAIQKKRLPASAKGTYFYDTFKTQKRSPGSYMTIKLPKLKNADLEKIAAKLRNLTQQETAKQSGIKERLRTQEESAGYLLNLYGLDADKIDEMSRFQKSRFFQLANLIMEEYGFDSDTAFRTVAETMNDTGKKASTLFNEYTKNTDAFGERYGIEKQ